MAHKCHGKRKAPGKRKILAAKEKCSRQKKDACDKKEIDHSKREISAAKEKCLRQKRKRSRQKKVTYWKKRKIAAREKLLQQKKVTHKKRQKNTAKGHKKNITRNKVLRKEKKIYFANFSRLLRLLCFTDQTLICCSR